MLSLPDMRKAFFLFIQPVVHDELFDFALKPAREANLDAPAVSEEDTPVFFKRIVAKLHGVSRTKEFLNPKKEQENTVKALTTGEPSQRELENLKVRLRLFPLKEEERARIKERRGRDHSLHRPLVPIKVVMVRRESSIFVVT